MKQIRPIILLLMFAAAPLVHPPAALGQEPVAASCGSGW